MITSYELPRILEQQIPEIWEVNKSLNLCCNNFPRSIILQTSQGVLSGNITTCLPVAASVWQKGFTIKEPYYP